MLIRDQGRAPGALGIGIRTPQTAERVRPRGLVLADLCARLFGARQAGAVEMILWKCKEAEK